MKRHRLQTTIALASLALLGACASTPRAPLPAGKVAIVAARYQPAAAFNAYASSRGEAAGDKAVEFAGKGLKNGALAPISLALTKETLILLPLAVVVAPYTAVIGALGGTAIGAAVGASQGMEEEEASALRPPIERAQRDFALHDALAAHVEFHAAEFGRYELAYHPGLGPRDPDEAPDYDALKAQAVRAVVELRVDSVGFEGTDSEPRQVAFVMNARGRVVPLDEETPAFAATHRHVGTARPVADWAADDGRLLEQEIEDAYQALGYSAAVRLFLALPRN